MDYKYSCLLQNMSVASTPNRADLGRAAWTLIHATADMLPNTPADMNAFISLVSAEIRLYPCVLCKTNANEHCGNHLSKLHDLLSLAHHLQLPMRTVAVAWAARFHACVTRHLQADGVLSALSKRIADTIERIDAREGAQDAEITLFITGH